MIIYDTLVDEQLFHDTIKNIIRKSNIDHKSLLLFDLNKKYNESIEHLYMNLYQSAIDYYKSKYHTIKSYKKNKITQSKYCIFHYYQLAYYLQLIKDYDTSLKYYLKSYEFLKIALDYEKKRTKS